MRLSLTHKFVAATVAIAWLGALTPWATRAIWAGAPAWVGLILCAGLAAAAGFVASRGFLHHQHELLAAAERMGAGDLSDIAALRASPQFPDERHDFVAGLSNMLEALRELVREVQSTSEGVSFAAAHLASASSSISSSGEGICTTVGEVAAGVAQQQRLIEDVTRLAGEMASAIELNAGRAREAFGFAAEANQKANSGVDVSRLAIEKMRSVFERVEQSGAMVFQLEAKTRHVHQITEIITSVASRTNLLSLNASIEAARAGEAGRGFAVVADEIRKLAESAARSADEISKLINEIEGDTQNVADEMRESGQVIGEGREDVNTIALSLEQIRGAVGEAAARAEEIFNEADNQSQDAERMVQSMQEIGRVAETNAASMEEVAGASKQQLDSMGEIVGSAEALTQRADAMRTLSQRFRAGNGSES